MASTALSEVALLRLAGGLRWAGALRAAAVTRSLTWGGVEGELIGARAGWQTYRGLSVGGAARTAGQRLGFDLVAQGGANYLGSNLPGWQRVGDAAAGVNLIETGMAIYGLRPLGIGVGSAMFQYSVKDGFVSPLNHRLSWQAFGAQAAIGTGFGYLGQGAEQLLTERLAYRLGYHVTKHLWPQVARPLWLGAPHLFTKVVPASIGITEETLENKAQDIWPLPGQEAPSDNLLYLPHEPK